MVLMSSSVARPRRRFIHLVCVVAMRVERGRANVQGCDGRRERGGDRSTGRVVDWEKE